MTRQGQLDSMMQPPDSRVGVEYVRSEFRLLLEGSMTGTIGLYYSFLRHLRTMPDKLSAMQLTGKLELWLTSEFAYHVHCESQGRLFAVMNTGTPKIGEHKIDLVVIRGQLMTNERGTRIVKDRATVTSLIEFKYFCNFRQLGFGSACDEIDASMASLANQLYRQDADTFARFRANLRGRHQDVYGFVFASHAHTEGIGGTAKELLGKIYDGAASKNLRYHDVKRPWLKPVYKGEKLTVLGRAYTMSLYAGLWRAEAEKVRMKAASAN